MTDRKKGNIFVIGQFVILLFALISAIVEPRLLNYHLNILRCSIGGSIAGIGIYCMVWSVISFKQTITAHPIPKEEYKLMREGIYKFIRHPIYFSAILMTIGGILLLNSYLSLFWAIILLVWFDRKAKFEEKFLLSKFPEYKEYQLTTKRIFPLIY